MGKRYESLLPNLRGVGIDDYIIFYYPRTDGIDVVRVVSGRRNLEKFFSQSE
jgi:toxin ParE1/3/4